MKTSLKNLEKELKEMLRIESIIGTDKVTKSDAIFLKKQAEEGSPRAMLDYGLFLLLNMESKDFALPWFEKQLKLSNGYALWRASGIFAELFDYLGDFDWFEWSMKCLRRSAWRQFKLSKLMLKDRREHPFQFPQA